jgi:hypothetical protein
MAGMRVLKILWGGALLISPFFVVHAVIASMFHGWFRVLIGLFALGILASTSYAGAMMMRTGFRYPSQLG